MKSLPLEIRRRGQLGLVGLLLDQQVGADVDQELVKVLPHAHCRGAHVVERKALINDLGEFFGKARQIGARIIRFPCVRA